MTHRFKNVQYDADELDYDEDDYEQGGEESYSAEDRERFAALTPVVRAELDEAGLQASDRDIEDSLWNYYWDIGKTVSYVKETSKPKSQKQAKQDKPKPQTKPKSKFEEAAERSAQQAGNTKTKQSVNGASGLTKRTEALKLNGAASSATEPAQSKVRSKGLDVPQLWAEDSKKRKKAAAFVVIGHVDHGKSTLMGRLLLDCGAVTQRDIDKYKKQASEMGKASFALAWVMDTGSEERERGVTVDIAQHHFSTEKTDFTILDAPGHRDFVPNMIGGASMADLAVLVVDANQLESGMKGQTKEHILLAKAAGLEKLIVAVNKLDSTTPAPWSEDVFDNVRNTVTKLLTDTGFSSQDVVTVPCSGLNGDNVAKAPQHNGTPAWVSKYPTLLAVLEGSVLPQPDMQIISGPVRMQIADVFRGGITNPLSVSGRIAAGNAQVGDIVLVQPSGETATVKDIEVNGEPRDFAVAGQISTLHLADVEAQHLRSGDVICSSSHPVVVVKSLTAMIDALDSILPQGVDVHIGRLHVPGAITQLISTVDAQGEQIRRKPRIIKAGQRAQVKVAVDAGIPIGGGERIVLRSAGETIAYGIVEKTTSK